ncbi:hypothetical protein FJY93_01755 [Candidatus Kaiserbacteria bacterium]|nr:hypothetical protein [Candidatus Kaiserbacteria bacterium]
MPKSTSGREAYAGGLIHISRAREPFDFQERCRLVRELREIGFGSHMLPSRLKRLKKAGTDRVSQH